ncbi:hypothetical protein FB45DRAFT_386034 [Roridomyces roridus]|uniref:Lysophospholipase n=1 Tax=Roridomyces roridus TaxID=1738132 RepID=A0AAD7F892_9AGAR|nr:hypothetical protein FB45DRAFT_386034 [Roridomyces roridus]
MHSTASHPTPLRIRERRYSPLCDGGEDGQVIIEIDVDYGRALCGGLFACRYTGASSSDVRTCSLSPYAYQRVHSRHRGAYGPPDVLWLHAIRQRESISLPERGPPRDASAPLTSSSTGQMVYGEVELQGILQQPFVVATQGAAVGGKGEEEEGPEWAACLACAVVDRARAREGARRSGLCERCFGGYCGRVVGAILRDSTIWHYLIASEFDAPTNSLSRTTTCCRYGLARILQRCSASRIIEPLRPASVPLPPDARQGRPTSLEYYLPPKPGPTTHRIRFCLGFQLFGSF